MHAYISVISQSWTTVCGPPTTLESLFSYSPLLRLTPKLRLPIGLAVHAPHLVRPDFRRIIGSSALLDIPIRPKVQIMSTSNCKLYEEPNLQTLLHQMIEDIAQNTLHLTAAVQAIAAILPFKDKVTLTAVGPSNHISLVIRALEAKMIKVSIAENAETLPTNNSSRGGSGSVAIIGMSGRFPGAENIHEFWDIIESGKELHKRVSKKYQMMQ
jgi:hypothetical protein